MVHQERLALIRSRLEHAFSPEHLEITDESDRHAGHAGYQGGGRHFAIVISAASLKHLSRVEAHRQIYALFTDMMPEKIHALKIRIV